MNLVVDMNLSPRWVSVLVQAGFAATHGSTLGAMDAPETEIMRYALEQDGVVLTHDLDFGAILAATHGKKPSVGPIRAVDVSPEACCPSGGCSLAANEDRAGARSTVDGGCQPDAPAFIAFCTLSRPRWASSLRLNFLAVALLAEAQGVIRPATIHCPACNFKTTASPDCGTMPVKAVMLT